MRSKPLIPLLAAAALTALLGCQTPAATPTSGPATHSVRVGDGPATAVVKLAPTYTTLADQAHRWVADDVNTYVVTLMKKQTGSDAYDEVDSVSLEQKVAEPGSTAGFTGLTPGQYQARVVAWGAVGGGDADTQLNSEPAIADLDLTTATSATGTATVTFDQVSADFSSGVTVTPPTEDGVFVAPSAAPTAGVDDVQ